MNSHDSSAPPPPAAPPIRTFRTRSGTIRAQRVAERRELELPVEFSVAGAAPIAGVATNLSIGGAFIQTDRPASFGADVVVSVRLPGNLGTASLDATVRWCTDDGMGVQFRAMGARETHGLTELLKAQNP